MRNDSVHSSSAFESTIHSMKTGDDAGWGPAAVENILSDGTLQFLRCLTKAFPLIEAMRKFPLIFFPSKFELSIFPDCEKIFRRRKSEVTQWFSSKFSMTHDDEVLNCRFDDCSLTLKQLEVGNKNFSQLSRKEIRKIVYQI